MQKKLVESASKEKHIRYYDLLMGMIEFHNKNYEEAKKYQEQALKWLPHMGRFYHHIGYQAVFHDTLALTYLKLGELGRAQEQYEKTTSLTEGRLGRGIIYAKSFDLLVS